MPQPARMAFPDDKPIDRMWFVSKDSQKGFTDDSTRAVTDGKGIPVIAPGYVARLITRIERDRDRQLEVQKKLLRQAWEELLDYMEEYDHYVEQAFPGQPGLAEFDSGAANKRSEMLGMARMLAILEFGHDYNNDPKEAIARIRQMALARFEE